MDRKEWPLWEVFIRSRNGLDHKHCGSVHAADPSMALKNARDVFTRRMEGVSVWVVRADQHRRERSGCEARDVRSRRRQDLPASDVLYVAGRSQSHVMAASVSVASDAHLEYVLRIADSSLILGHRLSEWCGHGPVLEEDIALTNVALDLIGQARSLYAYAGALEGNGRGEDQLAFERNESEFRNVTIVELPNGDYGFTIMRNFLFTTFQRELWPALQASAEVQLSEIARKSLTETRYHVQHASDWVIRLGDGTDESHARMQRALDTLWPYTAEFFSSSAIDDADARPCMVDARRPMVVRDPPCARCRDVANSGANLFLIARQRRNPWRAPDTLARRDAVSATRLSELRLVMTPRYHSSANC